MNGSSGEEELGRAEGEARLPNEEEALPKGFTDIRHAKFAAEYLRCGNLTEAARRAGYPGGRDYLQQRGRALMQRDDVSAFLAQQLHEIMSAEEAATRLSDYARANIGVFLEIDDDGNIHWNFNTPEAKQNMHWIKRIKQGKYGMEVEIQNPMNALAIIAKCYKLGSREELQKRNVEILLARLPPHMRDAIQQLMMMGHEAERRPSSAGFLPGVPEVDDTEFSTGDPDIGDGDVQEFEDGFEEGDE